MATADRALLDQWITRRDAEAFNTLCQAYAGMVYATCRRVLRDATEAEDAAQECFEKLASIKAAPEASLGPWLHRVAFNHSISRLRRHQRRRAREERYVRGFRGELEPVWDDIYPHVDAIVDELPEATRTAIVAHFFECRTHEEIAQAEGVTRSAVSHRIERGIEQVRKELRRRGIPVSGVALAGMLATRTAEAAPAGLVASVGKIGLSGARVGAPGVGASVSAVKGGLMAVAIVIAMAAAWWGTQPWGVPAAQDGPVDDVARTPVSVPASSAMQPPPESSAISAADLALSGASIEGTIHDARTGEGIAGVMVGISASPDTEFLTHVPSDKAGVYQVSGLQPGTYFVTPSFTNVYTTRTPSQSVQVNVRAGVPVAGVDFAMMPGIPVSGRVVDAGGRPVQGATIHHSETSADGSFSIWLSSEHALPSLCASKDGLRTRPLDPMALPLSGLAGLELVLDVPFASISGVVVDAEGHPAGDAVVWVESLGKSAITPRPNGTFHAANLSPGGVLLWAKRSGVRSAGSPPDLSVTLNPGDHLTGVRLTLPTQGALAIRGKVTDAFGNPLAGAMVRAQGRGDEGYAATSAPDGRFVLVGLNEGAYPVVGQLEGYTPAGVQAEAGVQDVHLVLRRPGRIEGRVVRADTGGPVSSFELVVVTEESEFTGLVNEVRTVVNEVRTVVVDKDGRFVNDVCAGRALVAVRAPGLVPVERPEVVPEAGTVSDLLFILEESRIIEGVVSDAAGVPIGGVRVLADSVDRTGNAERGGSLGIAHSFSNATITDGVISGSEHKVSAERSGELLAVSGPDGRFRIDMLRPNARQLGFTHRSYEDRLVPIEEATHVVLSDGARVEGTVTVAGNPAAGVIVSLYNTNEHGGLGSSSIAADNLGRFSFEPLKPGRSVVIVKLSPDHLVTAQVSEERTTRFVFDLAEPTSALGGRITVAGQPASEGDAVLLTYDHGGWQEGFHTTVGADGIYRFENLPAGEAEVWAGIPVPVHGWETLYLDALLPEIAASLDRGVAVGVSIPAGDTLEVPVALAMGPAEDASSQNNMPMSD